MFKRCIGMMVTALVLCLMFSSTAEAETPGVILDGKPLSFVESPPVMVNDRLLVPIWVIGEALDMNINWDHRSQTAWVKKNNLEIRVTIGQKTAFVNNEEVALDVPARIWFGRTMVPLRFISEAIGAKVEWDAVNGNVILTSPAVITEKIAAEDKSTKIHFIALEKGESIFIELPGQNHILIDTGSREDVEKVVEYLRSHRVDNIDLLVATHPDSEHIGGLTKILETFKVKRVIDSGFAADVWSHNSYLKTLSAAGITPEEDNKQVVTFNNASMKFLTGKEKWPNFYDPDKEHNPDDYSVICMLEVGPIKALFTGDAEERVERTLKDMDIRADILKAGRHGSSGASSLEFLRQVKPDLAVITVPSENRSGYPHLETLKRLSDEKIQIYRTDVQGTVVITIDNGRYNIKTEK